MTLLLFVSHSHPMYWFLGWLVGWLVFGFPSLQVLHLKEPGAFEACLDIFFGLVFPAMFPDRLSTVQGWIDLGRCVSADLSRFETIGSDASTTSVDAVSLGELIKVVSEQCRRHFKLNLHPADGLCRVHQIDSDVNGGDTRLLLLAPAGTRFMIQQPAESDQDFASAVRSSVAATHNAETQTNRLDLADLVESTISSIPAGVLEGNAESHEFPEVVMRAIRNLVESGSSAFCFLSDDLEAKLEASFASQSFHSFLNTKGCKKKMLRVVAHAIVLFWPSNSMTALIEFLNKVRPTMILHSTLLHDTNLCQPTASDCSPRR